MKIIICILLFLLTAQEGKALLPTRFHFRHYNIENGIPSNGISDIIQDSKGFIWIGTDNGLSRFDGTQFRFYEKKNPRYQNFQTSNITSICEVNDAEIWIGTEAGIYIYRQEEDIFTRFDVPTHKGTPIREWINYIVCDKEKNIWIATQDKKVFQYNMPSGKLHQIDTPPGSGNILKILNDRQNNIWASGLNNLYRLNKVANRFETFSIEGEKKGVYSMALWEDSNGELWIGTWEEGIWKLNPNTHKVEKYLTPQNGKGISHIHSILEYSPEILFIGSDDGLTIFNRVTLESKQYSCYGEGNTALSDKFVYPMLKDREGGIWIGTFYNGVNYLPPYSGQFKGYSASESHPYFQSKIISRFCEDSQGNVWIASDDGGLSCFMPAKEQFIDFPGREQLKASNQHSLCINGNELWIGTYSEGIQVLNMKTGQIRKYHAQHGLKDISIYAIFKDSQERIWTGSMHDISLYEPQTDSFVTIKSLDALIIDIKEDHDKNLWIATQGRGVFKFNPDKNVWKKYDKPQGVGCLYVNNLCIDKEKTLWIGTAEGLYHYDKKHDSFVYHPLEIPYECINSILEGENCLWLTTTKGLIKYTPQNKDIQIFTKSDGLQNEAFVMSSGLKTRNGEFYIGSINGFNTFYPHLLKTNTQKPPVVITGLEIFNQQIQADKNGLLQAPVDRLKEVHLSYKDNVITLNYAALSYCTPEKNQYAYKLDGFDKQWNYVGSQHSTTYTNLPAGTYTFRVKASNNDLVWNEQEAVLKIIVHPPFYLSLPFKIGYILLFFVLLGLLIHYFINRNNKKHAQQIRQIETDKEKEVHEAKINFFTMIAHEIRTPVSLIIGPLEKIMQAPINLPVTVRNDLEIIDRNSQRLLYLVNQLLDFRKVEQNEMKMEFTNQPVKPIMKAVCERFQPSFKQKGITLDISYPEDSFQADLDKEAITKVLSNLLTNANKYTKDQILVAFSQQPSQQTFTIQVTDNGQGMDQKEMSKIFKPFYQGAENKPGTGIGLSIVKGIVEAHHGIIEVDSKLTEGSTFTVILPVHQQDVIQPANNSLLPEDILPEEVTLSSSKAVQTMLIVDDNEDMTNFLSGNFKNSFTLLVASDGKEALEILKEHEVSIIISDWMMPNMSGTELCKAVRNNQLTSHIPFILLTAKTDASSKIEGITCGADIYIEKPFSLQYLEACVSNLLELRSQLRRKFSQMPTIPIDTIAENKSDVTFLEKMNLIIEENFANPELSVDFLAEKLCISRSGLFAKIKGLANITPNEMIQLVRLKKAASLLLENKYRINEVSYMVGFNNPSYFSKCFQKQFGIKPGEFIAAHTNQNTAIKN